MMCSDYKVTDLVLSFSMQIILCNFPASLFGELFFKCFLLPTPRKAINIIFFKEFLIFIIYLFIHLFLAVLGLRFCARAFSSCGERGPLFIAVRGPLTIVVAEHKLQMRRLSSCGSRA